MLRPLQRGANSIAMRQSSVSRPAVEFQFRNQPLLAGEPYRQENEQ
ncbi:MAG: hypothetical protein ACRD4M_10080 [Candidatus Acidiferrales bacterium]